MNKEEIKEYLQNCNNSVELIGKAAELKRNGEKESIVNRVVTELRKEMLNKSTPITPIKRYVVPDLQLTPTGRLQLSVNNLKAPMVVYTEDAVLL